MAIRPIVHKKFENLIPTIRDESLGNPILKDKPVFRFYNYRSAQDRQVINLIVDKNHVQ